MLILLDIDGVMVPNSNWKRPEFEDDGFPRFSSRATNSLQKIISETGAGILLTTSHKSNYPLKTWRNIFTTRGLGNVNIQKLRTNTLQMDRKEELIRWWNNRNEDHFVIIDDDKTLNSLPAPMKAKLVQPSATVGLNEELADTAIQILRS
ncbi:HAD domain-containing protein [Flagellimonas sp.]|uniref:HAD domain-containing protein n=1 Tax=Flagellimonas sp. TaxID=2058762 RepID=UPI003AB68267